MKKRNQKGFTLMELMVVIVIVAILAAVAVPLYINYVKDAQLTEAKGAIGAIISAEQTSYQRSAQKGAPTYSSFTDLRDVQKVVDVAEAEIRWTFTSGNVGTNGYDITATYKADPTVKVTYTFRRPAADGTGGQADFDK